MSRYVELVEELQRLEKGTCEFVWDELEEIITDDFEEDRITSDEFDHIMSRLMDIDCE